jgi:hypothetical protein
MNTALCGTCRFARHSWLFVFCSVVRQVVAFGWFEKCGHYIHLFSDDINRPRPRDEEFDCLSKTKPSLGINKF